MPFIRYTAKKILMITALSNTLAPMVKTYIRAAACRRVLFRKGYLIYMDNKKILRYSMQLSMLKQLLSKKLINETEYQVIQKRLMKDYGIVSNITA